MVNLLGDGCTAMDGASPDGLNHDRPGHNGGDFVDFWCH